MNRREVLLKEYEICQQSINNNTSRYWIVVSIFIGINTALWGAIAYKIAYNNLGDGKGFEWILLPTLATIFGIGMIVIIKRLELWLERVNWLIGIKYHRMREIENELGMRANIYIDCLDNWEKLSEKQKNSDNLMELHKSYPPVGKESQHVRCIYKLLMAIWSIIILMAWLFPLLNSSIKSAC